MKKNILWIEDESYVINGLFRQIKKEGFSIDIASSAIEAYEKAKKWDSYDIIVIDLIMPLCNDGESIPDEVKLWETEDYLGIGIAKWFARLTKNTIPILLLSVVTNPINRFDLQEYGIKYQLSKLSLLPSKVKDEIFSILGIS